MMVLSAEVAKCDPVPRDLWEPLVKMVGPYAPHLGEELWQRLGHAESLSKAPWPVYDASLAADDEVTVVVQVNGKLRDKFVVPVGTGKDELQKIALGLPKTKEWIDGKEIAKVIVVPGKLVNVDVK
jgi:leucyl-tRNA synthetase